MAMKISGDWCDLKKAPICGVKQGGKDSRRIETWKAHEIDCAISANQRRRLHVTDNAVIFNWWVAHEPF